MKSLPIAVIAGWNNKTVPGKWCPTSIDVICPHCGRIVNLRLERHQHDPVRDCISATCRCPACSKSTSVWVIAPGDGKDKAQRSCAELCVHPNPTRPRESIVPTGHMPEPALERAYHSAIRAYNAGLWDACAVSCRKTLEGTVRSLNPDGKGPLFAQLKAVFESANVMEPLVEVCESLRKGGNIGAHFDLEREPDAEVAEIMIDLLDYFLDYAFVLKDRAKALQQKLDGVGMNRA